MNWKRKTKNRRFERRHVLNVKMRTSQLRKIRLIKFSWMFLMISLTCLAIFMARQGGAALWQWAVASNPYFNIHRIEIETEGILTSDQIRQWAGVRTGLNLFDLDLTRVRRDLELIPVIASAEVERVLPDTLHIRIREREPVARFYLPAPSGAPALRLNPGYYSIDADGFFLVPLQPAQTTSPRQANTEHLPLLQGMATEHLRPGLRIESPAVQRALHLITTFPQSPMAGHDALVSLNLAQTGFLLLTTRLGSQITLGPQDLDTQLARWRKIHDYARQNGSRVRTLDLSITNNPPAVLEARLPDSSEP